MDNCNDAAKKCGKLCAYSHDACPICPTSGDCSKCTCRPAIIVYGQKYIMKVEIQQKQDDPWQAFWVAMDDPPDLWHFIAPGGKPPSGTYFVFEDASPARASTGDRVVLDSDLDIKVYYGDSESGYLNLDKNKSNYRTSGAEDTVWAVSDSKGSKWRMSYSNVLGAGPLTPMALTSSDCTVSCICGESTPCDRCVSHNNFTVFGKLRHVDSSKRDSRYIFDCLDKVWKDYFAVRFSFTWPDGTIAGKLGDSCKNAKDCSGKKVCINGACVEPPENGGEGSPFNVTIILIVGGVLLALLVLGGVLMLWWKAKHPSAEQQLIASISAS